MPRSVPFALAALALVAFAATAGVVVEEVPPGSAAEVAGLRAGDVISGWSGRAPGGAVGDGAVDTVLEWELVEVEIAPRGGAEVRVEREPAGAPVRVALPAGRSDLVVSPEGADGLVTAWRRARSEVATGTESAARSVAELEAMDVGATGSAAWWRWLQAGRLWTRLQRLDRAEVSLERAAAVADASGAPAAGVSSRLELALLLRRQRRYEAADDVLAEAERAARAGLGASSVALGEVLDRRGESARGAGDLDRAEELFRRGLEQRRTVAPGSLDEAASHNSLSSLAYQRGELAEAVTWCASALEIRERQVPGGLEVGKSHNNLGLISFELGDLIEADRHLRRALEIKRRRADSSATVANTLNNLSLVASRRGDLDSAQAFLEQTLEIERAAGVHEAEIARTLNNLGEVALRRGQWGTARRVLERSLELHGTAPAPTLSAGYTHANLGFALVELGELDDAEHHYRAAAELIRAVAPGGLDEARIVTNLAELAWRRGDLPAAEAGYRRAVGLKHQVAPGGVLEAAGRSSLASLLIETGQLDEARGELEAALVVLARLAPRTEQHARAMHRLGRIAVAEGRSREALAAWRAAIDILDDQVGRAGAGETLRAELRSTGADIHRDLIRLLVETGAHEEALGVLERSRARELAAMLDQREIALRSLPAELERERRIAAVGLERAIEALADADATDNATVEALVASLSEARRRCELVAERIRAVAPRAASLRDTATVDLETAVRALGPGTVALAYVFDDRSGFVFAVGPGERLAVRPLDASRSEVGRRVSMFRGLIAGEADPAVIRAAGSGLYRDLIGPVEEQVAAADRVVFVPDDPLLLLPWAALVRTDAAGSRWLAEWRPSSTTPSLAVLATLRSGAPPRPIGRGLAVADPPADEPGLAANDHRRLAPLPAARSEAAAVRAVLGEGIALRVGADATEAAVRAASDGVHMLHLATHVVLDDHRPLESAVVLAPSEAPPEDGLMHAWEVMASVRLDRALVALSGCDTGLGRGITGEGLIGLSRAFHFAGARSVVASLWRVEDRRTAEVMTRFYRHLGAGEDAVVALRAAQEGMIHGEAGHDGILGRLQLLWEALGDRGRTDRSHPASWAGFRIEGDWR